MKYIKTFEKMGVEDLSVQITEKVWIEFLKHYDESKVGSDSYDEFDVDITEFDVYDKKMELKFVIKYNQTESNAGFTITIGCLDRNNTNIAKKMIDIKKDILHEIKHMTYLFRKFGRMKGTKKIFSYEKDQHRFLDPDGVRVAISEDIVGAFQNSDGNLYNLKISIPTFLEKYNKLSKKYKELVVYLYFANQDEMSARLQEFYLKVKEYNDYKKAWEEEKERFIYYKNMINFKMNVDDFPVNEIEKLEKLFKLKNIKKVEKYINEQGQKMITQIIIFSRF